MQRNAIAGRSFAGWEAFEAHLAACEREVANARVHGTTGEAPMVRFARDELTALQPLADRPPFRTCRTLERRVKNDCAVEVDGNTYSVPRRGLLAASPAEIGSKASWPSMARLIGERVELIVAGGQVRVRHDASEVAVHRLVEGRRQRVIDKAHLAGVAGTAGRPVRAAPALIDDPRH